MENTIETIKQRFIDELNTFVVFRDLPSEVSQLLMGAIDQTEISDLIPSQTTWEADIEKKLEKLSLQVKDIVLVHIPAQITRDQQNRIYKVFSQMIKYAGMKIQIILLPEGISVEKLDNDQLMKVGLQHIPEIRYGLKEQTEKDLRERYEADPRYETMDFDEYLIEVIHNSGIRL